MVKEQAIHNFWSSFGVAAYDMSTVPTGRNAPEPPYITYQVATDNFYGGPVYLSATIWDRSSSWVTISGINDLVSERVGLGGSIVEVDGGYMWVNRGSPFSQRVADANDSIRRILINITVDFLTAT